MGLWDKMKSGVKSLGTSIKESDEVRLQRKKSERADLDRKLAVRRELREEDWQVKQRKQELRSYSPVTRAARKGKKIVKQGLRTTGAIAGDRGHRLERAHRLWDHPARGTGAQKRAPDHRRVMVSVVASHRG